MNCTNEVDLTVTWVHPAEPIYREVEYRKKVVVNFTLDMEFRSWGLKSVEVIPFGTATVQLTVKDFASANDEIGTEREVVVSVDYSKCKVKHEKGDGYGTVTVTGFTLHLTPEWLPDYRFSQIHVTR